MKQELNGTGEQHPCTGKDAKAYEYVNNVCVSFFLARVKYVHNFTLFCEKVSNVAIVRFSDNT